MLTKLATGEYFDLNTQSRQIIDSKLSQSPFQNAYLAVLLKCKQGKIDKITQLIGNIAKKQIQHEEETYRKIMNNIDIDKVFNDQADNKLLFEGIVN